MMVVTDNVSGTCRSRMAVRFIPCPVFIRGGSRNFERGVHKILRSWITLFPLWPFLNLLVGSLWKWVLHSGVQPCIRLYGDTRRMKQYLLFWLKPNVWSATQCIISKLSSIMQVTWAFFFSIEHIKWHIFFDFSCCCNANVFSRMADKRFEGSNSSNFKCINWYWCDRDAGVKLRKHEKLQYW